MGGRVGFLVFGGKKEIITGEAADSEDEQNDNDNHDGGEFGLFGFGLFIFWLHDVIPFRVDINRFRVQ